MGFSEQIRREVKIKAAFRCCRCQQVGVDVHHVVPRALGGTDRIDNAAPLCQNCHDQFGDNRRKGKEIRQMRDWWYNIVAHRYNVTDEFREEISRLGDNIEKYVKENAKLFRNLSRSIPTKTSKQAPRPSPTKAFLKQARGNDYVTVDNVHDPSAFALRVKGKSMGPRINDGDIVIVSPRAKVSSGAICVVRVKGEDTLKSVQFDKRFVHLVPLNPDFEPVAVKKADVEFMWKVVKTIANL